MIQEPSNIDQIQKNKMPRNEISVEAMESHIIKFFGLLGNSKRIISGTRAALTDKNGFETVKNQLFEQFEEYLTFYKLKPQFEDKETNFFEKVNYQSMLAKALSRIRAYLNTMISSNPKKQKNLMDNYFSLVIGCNEHVKEVLENIKIVESQNSAEYIKLCHFFLTIFRELRSSNDAIFLNLLYQFEYRDSEDPEYLDTEQIKVRKFTTSFVKLPSHFLNKLRDFCLSNVAIQYFELIDKMKEDVDEAINYYVSNLKKTVDSSVKIEIASKIGNLINQIENNEIKLIYQPKYLVEYGELMQNSAILLPSKFCESWAGIDKAAIFVTLLHELAHLYRVLYCHDGNMDSDTPEKQIVIRKMEESKIEVERSQIEEDIQKEYELGWGMEFHCFGFYIDLYELKSILNIADYLMTKENWDERDTFKVNIKTLYDSGSKCPSLSSPSAGFERRKRLGHGKLRCRKPSSLQN